MAQFYYAASTGGFYTSDIHRERPEDALPITAAHHQYLMQAQSDGLQITADAQGYPVATPPPPPSAEQLLRALREERDSRLAASDYVMMRDYPILEAQRDQWAAYRQQLRDLPETMTDPADMIWPEPPTGESN